MAEFVRRGVTKRLEKEKISSSGIRTQQIQSTEEFVRRGVSRRLLRRCWGCPSGELDVQEDVSSPAGAGILGLLGSRATPECWWGRAPGRECCSSSGSWEAAAQALQLAGGRWSAASVANALDALFNTYIKRVLISKSVSYANEWQLHLEEHPTV